MLLFNSFIHICFFTIQAHGVYIDPTHWPDAKATYINHARRGANLKLFPPIEVRGKKRVGFVAIKDVAAQEEFFWNYGYW